MDLEAEFKKFIEEKNLFPQKATALLAVSGGVDSMVMAELFYRCGYAFHIAHCNFKLRGKESGKDEKFVKAVAKKYNVDFYIRRFETKAYAHDNKLSIQDAARRLRYNWFAEL